MSVVLTPNNTRSVVKSPVNGDAADASTLTSETTQPIVNNDGFNFLASYGVCGALMVSSIDGVNLTVGALGAVRTTTLVLSTTAPATFSAATKLGGALANSARYYLYAYSNAGTLDYQVSTTAPQANRLYKTGSDDHALLSTFSTDSSGIILPYSQRGNDYTYAVPKISAALTANTWTDLDLPTSERSGILTRAGFLARTAHAVHPSPVRRGVFVLSRLLCVPPAPPPPNVNTSPPDESDPDQPKTNRERYAKHTAQDTCGGCHQSIDGVGFGFENYDALGKWRTLDNTYPVDASGELIGTDVDGPFVGALELSQKLATSTQAHNCVVSQVYRYALGRSTGLDDLCSLADLRGQFAAASGDIRALLLAVVTSDAFRFRRGT